MYIKGRAFELCGRELLNDFEKYKTIPEYVKAVLDDEKNPFERTLEFNPRIFILKIGGKNFAIVCDLDIISEERLKVLDKEYKRYHKKDLDITGVNISIEVDGFEREIIVELAEI